MSKVFLKRQHHFPVVWYYCLLPLLLNFMFLTDAIFNHKCIFVTGLLQSSLKRFIPASLRVWCGRVYGEDTAFCSSRLETPELRPQTWTPEDELNLSTILPFLLETSFLYGSTGAILTPFWVSLWCEHMSMKQKHCEAE